MFHLLIFSPYFGEILTVFLNVAKMIETTTFQQATTMKWRVDGIMFFWLALWFSWLEQSSVSSVQEEISKTGQRPKILNLKINLKVIEIEIPKSRQQLKRIRNFEIWSITLWKDLILIINPISGIFVPLRKNIHKSQNHKIIILINKLILGRCFYSKYSWI